MGFCGCVPFACLEGDLAAWFFFFGSLAAADVILYV